MFFFTKILYYCALGLVHWKYQISLPKFKVVEIYLDLRGMRILDA